MNTRLIAASNGTEFLFISGVGLTIEVSTASGSDRVAMLTMIRDQDAETRSLPLSVLTSCCHMPLINQCARLLLITAN